MSGRMRAVLWALGSLGVLWAIFWLYALTAMTVGDGMMGGGGMVGPGGMMSGGGMTEGGMMGSGGSGGPMSLTAGAMIGGMLTQTLAMLGLIGIFVYLVADTVRNRE